MKIMYVDDENLAIIKFQTDIDTLRLKEDTVCFSDALEALEYAKQNPIDVAFLDIEMPGITGLELAERLQKLQVDIRIIFVTGYHQYALKAYQIDALGYLLKPYNIDDLKKELDKAERMGKVKHNDIFIKTIPNFDVFVDGKPIPFGRKKVKELLALLVDRAGSSISSGDCIAYLWEDKPEDEKAKNLLRVTYKRLKELLEEYHIERILNNTPSIKAIDPEAFRCDYYNLIKGSQREMLNYSGAYMEEYSWAEETNCKIGNYISEKKKLSNE